MPILQASLSASKNKHQEQTYINVLGFLLHYHHNQHQIFYYADRRCLYYLWTHHHLLGPVITARDVCELGYSKYWCQFDDAQTPYYRKLKMSRPRSSPTTTAAMGGLHDFR